jgi:hypothetical protein
MGKHDPFMEARIVKALKYKDKNPRVPDTKIAIKFQVTYSKLRARIRGVPAANTKGGQNANLSLVQDEALMDFIDYLISIGHQASKKHIILAGNAILKADRATRDTPLDSQWAKRWFIRHKKWYKTIRTRSLCFERKAAHNIEDVYKHFKDFEAICQRYGIDPADIYNMDETGFRIGCLEGRIVITHIETKAVFLVDPDNRDYITSVETICGDGTAIPPLVILKGTVLLEKHFKNDMEDDTLMAMTSTGYIDNTLGLLWLEHFNKMTYKKLKGTYRLLMLDGQSSHITEEFTVYCWLNKIVPFLLPPHMTHLLQPNDIGIFQHLKHWHQEDIACTIQYGDIQYDKLDFLNGFKRMRDKTFRPRTIRHAWEEAGLMWKGKLCVRPEVILQKMALEFSEDTQPATPPPLTPLRRPFQHPPASRDRATHQAYLDKRLDDHFEYDVPLTPSYRTSLQAFQASIEPKLLTSTLIKQREQERIEHVKERARQKSGTGRHIQKGGVIYKKVGLLQTLEMENKLREAHESGVNKKEERIMALGDKILKRIAKVDIPKHYKSVCTSRQWRKAYMAPIFKQLQQGQYAPLIHDVDFTDFQVST